MNNNVLDLSGLELTAEGATQRLLQLEDSAQVNILDLSNNDIELDVSSVHNSSATDASIMALTESDDLAENSFIVALSNILKKLDINEVNFNNNLLRNEGAEKIAEILKTNNKIKFIDLEDNEISIYGACCIAEAIKLNTTLQYLNLNTNKIGKEGIVAIAEALKENTGLTYLDLGTNSLEYEGIEALRDALQENQTLRGLNLSSNNIANNGLEIIINIMNKNSKITNLNLSSNFISDAGAQAIATIITTSPALTTLILNDNTITPTGAQIISNALERNITLTTLELGGNAPELEDSEALKRIKELLVRNNEIANEKDPVKKFTRIKNALGQNNDFPTLWEIARHRLSTIIHHPEALKLLADTEMNKDDLTIELNNLKVAGKLEMSEERAGTIEHDAQSLDPEKEAYRLEMQTLKTENSNFKQENINLRYQLRYIEEELIRLQTDNAALNAEILQLRNLNIIEKIRQICSKITEINENYTATNQRRKNTIAELTQISTDFSDYCNRYPPGDTEISPSAKLDNLKGRLIDIFMQVEEDHFSKSTPFTQKLQKEFTFLKTESRLSKKIKEVIDFFFPDVNYDVLKAMAKSAPQSLQGQSTTPLYTNTTTTNTAYSNQQVEEPTQINQNF